VRHDELAVAIGEQLVADFPTNAFYVEALLTSYNNLGAVHGAMGRFDLARPILERLVELRIARFTAHPDVPSYEGMIGMAENNLGGVLMRLDELEDAGLHFARARARAESTLRALPNDPAFQTVLRFAAFNVAYCHLSLGDHAMAAAALVELPFPETANDWLLAAAVLCDCVELAASDEELSSTEREETRAEYVHRACAFLEQAVAHGYRDRARLASAPGWEPIRDEPDFESVLESIDSAK
jgi:tetratricopeptide (TPR) repeat protein